MNGNPHALMVKREDTGALTEALGTATGALKTEAVGGTAPPSVTQFSDPNAFVIQLGISAVSFKLRHLQIYTRTSGFVTIHNKATAVVNGEAPHAAFVLSVAGGQHYNFPLPDDGVDLDEGCQVALCSSIGAGATPQITLAASVNMLVFAQGDPIV